MAGKDKPNKWKKAKVDPKGFIYEESLDLSKLKLDTYPVHHEGRMYFVGPGRKKSAFAVNRLGPGPTPDTQLIEVLGQDREDWNSAMYDLGEMSCGWETSKEDRSS